MWHTCLALNRYVISNHTDNTLVKSTCHTIVCVHRHEINSSARHVRPITQNGDSDSGCGRRRCWDFVILINQYIDVYCVVVRFRKVLSAHCLRFWLERTSYWQNGDPFHLLVKTKFLSKTFVWLMTSTCTSPSRSGRSYFGRWPWVVIDDQWSRMIFNLTGTEVGVK